MIQRRLVVAGVVALASVASGALGLPAAAQTSPLGAGNRLLLDGVSELAVGQLQFGANTLTAAFGSALQRSRDTAAREAKPIPDDIRRALEPFYPEAVLANVRYTIGDTTPAGLAGFAIRNGNAAAVTLIDTIVFKEADYTRNLALWAHELHHIEQYRQWGLDGFASRYVFGWAAVEQEASDKADAFVAWYAQRTHRG